MEIEYETAAGRFGFARWNSVQTEHDSCAGLGQRLSHRVSGSPSPCSKDPIRFVIVVRLASEPDVVDGRRPAERERPNVMEFQAAGFGTSTLRSDKGAPALIS
jgi:hypothetical protein